MLGSAQDFCDTASKITQINIDFSELKRSIKDTDKVIREVKVMLADVLADISGGKVDGEKVHPVLQKVAWSHVK